METTAVASVALVKILIADDQPDILEALQILLKNEGFSPHVATSPRAVVEAVQRENFDIVLMDMNYARDTTSGLEGLELLARIKLIDDALPIVLMTAWGSVDLAVEAMQDGGRDFVQKPWDNAKLIAILRRQLSEGRILREKVRRQGLSQSLISEVAEAREVQERLLPCALPQVRGCDVQAMWQPAAGVGGDYFDIIRLNDDTIAFCIADVCGKGLPAALMMAHLRATVRAVATKTMRPSELCRQVNRTFAECMTAGKFITMFYAVLDVAAKQLRYTNAGHLPPVLTDVTGKFQTLEEGGTLLGAFPDSRYEERQLSLNSGDRIVLFTDGITEATNTAGEEFGRERVRSIVTRHCASPAAQLQQELLADVSAFASAAPQDDATLLIISLV